jgi:hypothetical protein
MSSSSWLGGLTPRSRRGVEVRDDHYYCYLVPLTLPPTLLAIYLNWLGMMFYKHN